MSDTSIDIDTATGQARLHGFAGNGDVSDYFALLKPRVMSLVIFTALVGIVVAPGGIHPWLGAIALLCVAVGAGASGALNMWYDADIDAVMKRTASRPVPAGRVLPGEALTFGMWLATASVLMLGIMVNWAAAGLLAFTIFFYAVIYTMWLKRSTPQNIVIGGAAGAFPPMVGWTAVTGSFDLASVTLFAIIFMWTPPHFWALALFRANDYQRAGIPMMPNVAGADETRRQILLYSLAMIPVTLSPLAFGLAGWLYGMVGLVLSVVFAWRAWQVYKLRQGEAADRAAKKLFGYSIIFLFAVFATLLIEQLIAALPAIMAAA